MMRVPIHLVCLFVLVLVCCCGLGLVTSAASDDARIFLVDGPTGTSSEQQCLATSEGRDLEVLGLGSPLATCRSGELLWQRYFSDAICQTTAISIPAACVCAGTWLNPPQEVECIPLVGDGSPDWVFAGVDFHTAASRNGEVLAGVDKLASGLRLHKWHPGSAAPDWSYAIPSATVMGVRCLVVSPDGSTIALVVTMQNPQFVRLYVFDPSSGEPTHILDAPGEYTSGNIDITADGRYIAFFALINVYVFDRDTGGLRWSGSMGGYNDPLAISGDGRYLAYGWTSLTVRQWNGSTYALLWTTSGANFWLGSCRFSYDAGTFVAGWYDHNTYRQNKIQLYDMPLSTPRWTYLYTLGSGTYQDVPYEIAITDDGGYLAVGSWGDAGNTNPEVHVFEHGAPQPVMTLDTPGSVFGIDIAVLERGSVYVSACGKHIHANENGRGGDLYCLRLADPAATGGERPVPAGGEHPESAWLAPEASPNPFAGATTFHLAPAAAGKVQLAIYSPAGRLVRRLRCAPMETGVRGLAWDGRTESGQVAEPGVYFVLLEGGARTRVGRVVKVQ